MNLAITIFLLSFVGILFLLINKSLALHGRKAFVTVSHEVNHKLKTKADQLLVTVKRSPEVVWKTFLFLIIKISVIAIEKFKARIYPKIAHLVDSVKGRHIPKNKGSASFFLTNIKEHKDSQKGFEI